MNCTKFVALQGRSIGTEYLPNIHLKLVTH